MEKRMQKKNRRGNPAFGPGHVKMGGRVKGTPNKVPTMLKEAITKAAAMVGSDGKGKDGVEGYLSWLAKRHPQVFGRLMEKLLPFQLTGKDGGPVMLAYKTKKELAQRFKERGLPTPQSLMESATNDAPDALQ